MKELDKKLIKAMKEIDEAEDAVLDAVEAADEDTKEFLARAEMDLEKAEAKVTEAQE